MVNPLNEDGTKKFVPIEKGLTGIASNYRGEKITFLSNYYFDAASLVIFGPSTRPTEINTKLNYPTVQNSDKKNYTIGLTEGVCVNGQFGIDKKLLFYKKNIIK